MPKSYIGTPSTKDHPEYFAGDRVHLKPAGQDFYVEQIMAALGRS